MEYVTLKIKLEQKTKNSKSKHTDKVLNLRVYINISLKTRQTIYYYMLKISRNMRTSYLPIISDLLYTSNWSQPNLLHFRVVQTCQRQSTAHITSTSHTCDKPKPTHCASMAGQPVGIAVEPAKTYARL